MTEQQVVELMVRPLDVAPRKKRKLSYLFSGIAAPTDALAFRISFVAPRNCFYCGGGSHSRDTCKLARRMVERGIIQASCYIFCESRATHTMAVCPTLHSRCYGCHKRGHHIKQCKTYTQDQL